MVLSLIIRNTLRHKLRTGLTILGIAVAVMAFGLIRTVLSAWYSGVEGAAPDRLITRNSVSIIFTLPLSYRDQILKIDGIKQVTWANWFGGTYVDPDNFFAQFAVDKDTYFEVFPEFVVPPAQFEEFQKNPRAVIVGRKLADRFGWKVGDRITLIGTVYSGDWDFDVVSIYTGKDQTVDESSFFFRWDYLDEWIKKNWPGYGAEIGWFGLKLSDPNRATDISAAVDARFKNSSAETLTETEKAFQMSFVQMSGTILTLLQVMSILIICIILMVLVNTMAMAGRERTAEHAYMKSMGFRAYHLIGMISGESLVIAGLGGALGLLLLVGVTNIVKAGVSQWFPIFTVTTVTFVLVTSVAILIGLLASIFPAQRAVRMKIVDGLRVVD
jgi:putative ABC transport system permease protein